MKTPKVEIALLTVVIFLLGANIYMLSKSFGKIDKIEKRIEKIENISNPELITKEDFCNKACSIYCLSYGCIPIEAKVFKDGRCYCKIRSETAIGNRIYRITSWINLGVIENVEEILVVNASK